MTLAFSIAMVFNSSLIAYISIGNYFVVDVLSSFGSIMLLIASFCTIYIVNIYIHKSQSISFEYYFLIMLSIIGMIFMIYSYNFISLYLSLELQSLSLYLLAAFNRGDEFSTEAGIKYFILGGISSCILLFGISIYYGSTGNLYFSINFENNYELLDDLSFQLGLVFILVALLFKLGIVPFHSWVADVYEGTSISSTAFFSIVPKISIIIVLCRLTHGICSIDLYFWQVIFVLFGAVSIIIGTFLTLAQRKIKRLLAFSSITHSGYLILALSCMNFEGYYSLLIYTVVYTVMNIAMFSIIISLRNASTGKHITHISDLNNLFKVNPLLAILLSILLFSMAGIPPFAGFFSKLYIFISILGSNYYFVSIIIISCSVISCVYYIRVIKVIYFESISTQVLFKNVPTNIGLLMISSLYIITCFFFNPYPLLLLVHNTILMFIF
jgi:NADH-quinone oxidoreductase subunit N